MKIIYMSIRLLDTHNNEYETVLKLSSKFLKVLNLIIYSLKNLINRKCMHMSTYKMYNIRQRLCQNNSKK